MRTSTARRSWSWSATRWAAERLACAAAALLATQAAAGPWVPEPGHGYAKIGGTVLPGVGFFRGRNDDGPFGVTPIGAYIETGLSAYAELGVAGPVAVAWQQVLLRTFVLVDPVDGASAFASVGEPRGILRVRLVQRGSFALGVEGFVEAPTSGNRVVAKVHATLPGQPEVGGLRIARGVWSGGAALSAGLGFARMYALASVGAEGVSDGWDSVLRWQVEVGGALRGPLEGRVRLYGVHPLRDGRAPYHLSPSGIGNGTGYAAFTLELDRLLADGLRVTLSLAGGVAPVARQIGGPVLGLALGRRF